MGACLALVALVGCSDDGVTPLSGGTAADDGAGSTTASVSTTMTASASSSQGGMMSTADPVDDGDDNDVTLTAGEGTAGISDSGSGDAGDDTGRPGSTGGGSTGDDDGATTGEPVPTATTCDVDADCVVVNDCCGCTAAHADDAIEECPEVCRQPMCDASGLAGIEAECVFGQCQLQKVSCNDLAVQCDAPTPACAAGMLPSVTEDGNCWTGQCVPAEACDVVPDCSWCAAADTCVQTATQLGPYYACWPTSADCEGEPSCACMAGVCTDPFICAEGNGVGGSDLGCACPVCG